MAFLFKPAIPTEGMEGLSTPADPLAVGDKRRPMPEPPASSAEPAAPDAAALEEFLLKNFLTEDAPTESPSENTTELGVELPRAEDLDTAIENIVDPTETESNPIVSVDANLLSDLAQESIIPENPKLEAVEWAFEETLANHKEWLDSHGELGKRADLRKAKLEGMELIGVGLRYADLQDANLKAADLLLADLRDALLVRANLQETCLVGANMEGANLEGASLETAMGMLPRQLAGANLHEASLPAQILEFNALPAFVAGSKTIARLFGTMMVVSFLSFVMIWKTKDIQLLSDSAIISFLHSPAAAAECKNEMIAVSAST